MGQRASRGDSTAADPADALPAHRPRNRALAHRREPASALLRRQRARARREHVSESLALRRRRRAKAGAVTSRRPRGHCARARRRQRLERPPSSSSSGSRRARRRRMRGSPTAGPHDAATPREKGARCSSRDNRRRLRGEPAQGLTVAGAARRRSPAQRPTRAVTPRDTASSHGPVGERHGVAGATPTRRRATRCPPALQVTVAPAPVASGRCGRAARFRELASERRVG